MIDHWSARSWLAQWLDVPSGDLELVQDTADEETRLLRYAWRRRDVGSVLMVRVGQSWIVRATLPDGRTPRCEVPGEQRVVA